MDVATHAKYGGHTSRIPFVPVVAIEDSAPLFAKVVEAAPNQRNRQTESLQGTRSAYVGIPRLKSANLDGTRPLEDIDLVWVPNAKRDVFVSRRRLARGRVWPKQSRGRMFCDVDS